MNRSSRVAIPLPGAKTPLNYYNRSLLARPRGSQWAPLYSPSTFSFLFRFCRIAGLPPHLLFNFASCRVFLCMSLASSPLPLFGLSSQSARGIKVMRFSSGLERSYTCSFLTVLSLISSLTSPSFSVFPLRLPLSAVCGASALFLPLLVMGEIALTASLIPYFRWLCGSLPLLLCSR